MAEHEDNPLADEHVAEYRDALPGLARRRAAGLNPGNRFEAVRLHLLGEFLDDERRDADSDEPKRVPTQVFADQTQTLINQVARTSDVPFDWTVNPYRGCEHGWPSATPTY